MPEVFTHKQWDALLTESFDEIRKLATLKGGEYSGDEDRLLNFRRNGDDLGLAKEVIWRVYAAKHWDALGQFIRDLAGGKERTRLESIEGRVNDLLVYLLLFKAMVRERDGKMGAGETFGLPPIKQETIDESIGRAYAQGGVPEDDRLVPRKRPR